MGSIRDRNGIQSQHRSPSRLDSLVHGVFWVSVQPIPLADLALKPLLRSENMNGSGDPKFPFGKGKPFRERFKWLFARGPSGKVRPFPIEGDINQVGENGAHQTHEFSVHHDLLEEVLDRFHSCGCSKDIPSGGKCAEPGCGNITCKVCFQICRCANCLKPLCMAHVHRVQNLGNAISLCTNCFGVIRRKEVQTNLTRLLLSPFVEMEEDDE